MARACSSIPGVGPAFGPIGDVDNEVVFEGGVWFGFGEVLAAPDRETEVVANQEEHFPAFDGCDEAFLTGGIVIVFGCVGKPVSFIVAAILTIGKHPDEPVEVVTIFFDD